MKLPRGCPAITWLARSNTVGYGVIRQKGSHLQLGIL